MDGVINGRDAIFSVLDGDEYVPYVCAKDLSIETTSTLIEVSTVGDGAWSKFKHQSIGYSINMSGVVRIGTGVFSAFEMLLRQINFLDLKYKIECVAEDGIATKTIKGTCLVERNSITGNTGQLALNDISLRGSGAFRIIDCDAVILLAGVETDGNDAIVTLSSIDGFPALFYYQMDNGMEVESTETTFRFSSVPEGYHTITVTPACESGKRGDPIIIDWANVSNPVNPTCGVPTSLAFTAITDTTMTITWSAGLNNTSVNLSFKNLTTGNVVNKTNLPGTSYNATGLIPGATYAITIRANCGVEQSSTITQNVTMTYSGARPYIQINNGSSNVRVHSISLNGVVVTSGVIDVNSNDVAFVSPGTAEIVIEYNHIDSSDASITVQNSGRRQCQPVGTGVQTVSWGTFSIGTEGLEVYINSSACRG